MTPAIKPQKDQAMSINKNRIKGAANQAAGATKAAAANLVGDDEMEMAGKQTKAKGKLQSAVGKAQSAAGKASDKLKRGLT